ncbi:glycosyltransferase 9 family protein [Collimonas arenae]|uniref:Glycosyltransferase 9 family protein n=1 Tax=Collimonas arenae TaxID=279058 RepID=A0A127QL99_9BURK|nr:tetratricopeptide repeat-containing glycosyltransferase family protein [Collimonas arenae]AMP10821.1 glycosyltransferase 9 family protein [Collimonas arenae]
MNSINPIQQAYKDFQNGNADRAERSLKNILSTQPENFDALHILGVISAATGKRDEAIRLFKKAIGLAANDASLSVPLQYKLARVQFESGRFDEALLAYEHILSTGYVKPEILLAKTVTLASLERYQEALHCIGQALAHWPDYADGWSHQAGILYKLGHFDEALGDFDRAIALQPTMPYNWYQKGLALDKLERYADALDCLDRAVTLDPKNPAHWLDRGVVRHKLGRYVEALSDHETGLALTPRNAEAWGDHGLTLSRMRRHEEALSSYGKALGLKRDYPDVLSNQSLSQLVLGQFEQGWRSYEYRWKKGNADTPRHTDIPLWLGEQPISGKRILLWSEQGLGDTIHFCRYAPMVAALGADVVLEVDPSLKTIAQTMGNGIKVIGIGETVPQVDYQTPLMSLPLVFKTNLDTIPATIPNGHAYFHSDDAKAQRWKTQQNLAEGKLRIGLVCSGNPGNTNDQRRSMALAEFAPLLQSESADFFLIQKEVREADLAFLQRTPKLRLSAADIDGFDDTAAIIANLDLVISVDTSIAHLAGALGKPVWILLPWVPDWRWLLERDDSPWYPSVRLFRQQQAGDWQDVVQRVADALQVWQSVTALRTSSNFQPD